MKTSIGKRLAAMLAIVVATWLFAASAPAQAPHSHDGQGEHTHAAGEVARAAEPAGGSAGDHGSEHGYSGLAGDLPFWGIVAFIGFLLAIKKLGWGSFTAGLAGREAEEQRLISEAEDLRRRAAEQLMLQRGQMEALDEEVRGVFAEADRDAEHTRRDIRAAADREAAAARTRVELEIGRVKDQTLSELFERFSQQIIESTQNRLHGKLDPAAQDKLIDASLAEFAAGQSK